MITFASHQARAGHSGASEDFEQMLGLLVRATSGEANLVFANPGDWGIDVLVGDLRGRVTVWQAKYFARGVGRSQQGQITASFNSALQAAADHGYALEHWVLCIPASMDGPTTQWWQNWKAARQHHTGVLIDLWDETKLRELLLRPEAADVRRHYYNPYRHDGQYNPYRHDGQADAPTTATEPRRPGDNRHTGSDGHPGRRRFPPDRRTVMLGGLAAAASAAIPAALVLSRVDRPGTASPAAPVVVTRNRIIATNIRKVDGVAFRPDGGGTLASINQDGVIRLWDTATWAEPTILTTGVKEPVIAFSPYGGILAIGDGVNPAVWLLDRASKNLTPLRGQDGQRVFSVAFSPDGKKLASGSPDRWVDVWDVPRKSRIAGFFAPSGVDSVAFLDGRSLVIGCDDATVQLRDLSGAVIMTFAPPQAHPPGKFPHAIESVAFRRDEAMLASGGADSAVRLWNAATGSPITVLRRHTNAVESVVFSPDGKTLASASMDSTIRLWDTTTYQQTAILYGHNGEVESISFSPDGKTLASAGTDSTIRLWKVP